MNSKIIIYGVSDYSKRISKYVKLENAFDVVGFCVHNKFLKEKEYCGLSVYSFEHLPEIFDMQEIGILIALGYSRMNDICKEVYNECVDNGFKVVNFLSKYALIQTDKIGNGNIILPGVYIGVGSDLGNCNRFEPHVVLSHDNSLGNFNFISTNVVAGGRCCIANNCFVGLNSTLKSGILIDDYSLVGQGTNVLQSTDKYGVYVGNPAKKIKNNSLESKI